MNAVLTQVRAAILRRRAQTVTVVVICLLASAVATMALTLLIRSTQPWDDAFARYSGNHLTFSLDATKVSAAQLEATASLPGVVAATPPYETVVAPFQRRDQKASLYLIGRPDPGGSIDRIPIAAGRWPQRPGEIIVTRTEDSSVLIRPHLGETIQALTSHGTVVFKVVGEAISLGGHGSQLDYANMAAPAWVMPSDVEALVDGGKSVLGYEIGYRFRNWASAKELDADRKTIEAALPANSETGPVASWIQARGGSIWLIVLLSGIILSFTIFALLAVTLIVASVVAGSVLSSYREIGISKALGFTPAQVVVVYVGQMAVPGLAGGILGVPLGALLSRPFLNDAASSLKLPPVPVLDPVVDFLVPLGLVALVVLAALVPALRAAATDSTRAMVLGSAPTASRRSRLAEFLAGRGLPRAMSIGAGDAFARPVRALMTVIALGIGIATATFAIGFQSSLVRMLVTEKASYGYSQDVTVYRFPGMADSTLVSRLAADPDTSAFFARHKASIRVPGMKDAASVSFMRGDATALGYRAVTGRWFSGPGEAVIGGNISRQAHLNIGDSVNLTTAGAHPLSIRVVGLFNDFNTNGLTIATDVSSLGVIPPEAEPDEYLVKLQTGADAKTFAKRIEASSPDFLSAKPVAIDDVNLYVNLISFMVGGLALVLMLIAAAGVFNAARLTTRERVRDVAIFKALGMTRLQTLLMVVTSTLVLAVVATIAGIPVGIWLQNLIWSQMLSSFGLLVSPSGIEVLPLLLALVVAFGLAVLGSWLPARWAAATPVAQVLRSE